MEDIVEDASAFEVPHDDSDEEEEPLPQQVLDIEADRDEQDYQNKGLRFQRIWFCSDLISCVCGNIPFHSKGNVMEDVHLYSQFEINGCA